MTDENLTETYLDTVAGAYPDRCNRCTIIS